MQLTITEQQNAYKEYIDNHRQNVMKAWNTIKTNPFCVSLIIKNLNEFAIDVIEKMVEAHDLSKYGKEEFEPYRKQFYPVSPEEKESNKDAFDKAWKHHYYNNLHHWDWWHETNNKDSMSLLYVVEMICDWEAMGYKFGNTSKEWYTKNKENIHLGDKQRKFAEELMDIICG